MSSSNSGASSRSVKTCACGMLRLRWMSSPLAVGLKRKILSNHPFGLYSFGP